MKKEIYVARLREDEYEVDWFNIGCYSTIEKAKEAIIEELRNLGEILLSLETYAITKEEDGGYDWEIEKFVLDE